MRVRVQCKAARRVVSLLHMVSVLLTVLPETSDAGCSWQRSYNVKRREECMNGMRSLRIARKTPFRAE